MGDEETKGQPPRWQSWEVAAVPVLPQMAVGENLRRLQPKLFCATQNDFGWGRLIFRLLPYLARRSSSFCPPLAVLVTAAPEPAAARLRSRSKP